MKKGLEKNAGLRMNKLPCVGVALIAAEVNACTPILMLKVLGT